MKTRSRLRSMARCVGLVLLSSAGAAPAANIDYRARAPEDEVIYFVLPDRFENGDEANDRGGLAGDRTVTGYDPTSTAFYHGGDLKGLKNRLAYIQALGATAIWLTPIFKNKTVQGSRGEESAGYHGYWITDFTHVDPHLGTDGDFKALVDAAHARGMKVYMDIVVNHTADVIYFKECANRHGCPYRSIADYPYQRHQGVVGRPINVGFSGEHDGSPKNFAKLRNPNYAYTVVVKPAERNVKVPAWLNDPINYHNRGDSTFRGESSAMGDFSGLDDLFTESPRVVNGMIEIYAAWIDRYGIDGFRIDTAQHVNPEFFQRFVPAMLKRARARGIPNFHIFGEVATGEMDPAHTAVNTRVDKLPAVLDFSFTRAVVDVVSGAAGTDELAKLFRADALYEGGAPAAMRLPTFLGNHDAGRFPMLLRLRAPALGDDSMLRRDLLGHAMLLTLRGVPTIYYGDEQGFVGIGGDQQARQDMFPSKVQAYNSETRLGTSAAPATERSNFNAGHPLYQEIAKLAHIRTTHPALTRGLQLIRFSSDKPGLFAVSRLDPSNGREMLLVFNSSSERVHQHVRVETDSTRFEALAGACPLEADAPGTVTVDLAPLAYAVCYAH